MLVGAFLSVVDEYGSRIELRVLYLYLPQVVAFLLLVNSVRVIVKMCNF